MAQELNYRDIGMDIMEQLYYERKDTRQRAYTTKRKKTNMKKRISSGITWLFLLIALK